tara:strand:- start:46 stop:813 length:768 start_codon:yes stop_codon:yes gene_type:complete
MVRRRFSKPPTIGKSSRASDKAPTGDLTLAELMFKKTYVFERSFLQQFRGGEKYKPSPSYDGKSRWDTPEEKPGVNGWVKAYKQVESKTGMPPSLYVRILFKILRGSSVYTPTPDQLTSPQMLGLVTDYIPGVLRNLREQFVAEAQRAKTAITIQERGAGHRRPLAVYYALTDNRVGLSPLFKYCMAFKTASACLTCEEGDVDRLSRLANSWKFDAAMDYSLFPDKYDEVWGSTIPELFRVAVTNLIDSAIEQVG